MKLKTPDVRARLKIIDNLEALITKLKQELINGLNPDDSDVVEYIAEYTPSAECYRNTIEFLMERGYIECDFFDPPVSVFELNERLQASIRVPVRGGTYILHDHSPCETHVSVGVDYETNKKNIIELTHIETKSDELANIKNNKNIDMYVYGNVLSEEYTDKFTIEYDSIDDAFDEDE